MGKRFSISRWVRKCNPGACCFTSLLMTEILTPFIFNTVGCVQRSGRRRLAEGKVRSAAFRRPVNANGYWVKRRPKGCAPNQLHIDTVST